MAQKLALVLAVLAVSCITINATVSNVNPSSNFNVTPQAVVDNSTDSNFVNYTGIYFVPGFDNTTIFVYGVNATGTDGALAFVRRSINASTIATINSTDSKISTTLSYNTTYKCAVGLGYFACATVYNSTASSYPDLTFSYTAVNGTFSSVKITSNADYNYTYYPTSIWYDTNYFYIVYVSKNATTTNDVLDESAYLQAVKVTDGSKLYASPLKVASLSGSTGTTYVTAGPTNASNSSTINVVYRTNTSNATYYVAVTNGTAGSPVTLFTDAGNVTYIPGGTLGSFSNSGVFVKKIDATASPSTNSTYGFYNGNTTAVVVASSTMSGYAAPTIMGIKFTDGYVLFETYPSATTGGDSAYYLDFYFANQTRNGSAQVSLGTYGAGLQPFVDANGAVWGGYYSYDKDYGNGFVVKAYLGKLIAQINSGASVLASFFAFISLMIAAIFAF